MQDSCIPTGREEIQRISRMKKMGKASTEVRLPTPPACVP
jgi:hypothetical protein